MDDERARGMEALAELARRQADATGSTLHEVITATLAHLGPALDADRVRLRTHEAGTDADLIVAEWSGDGRPGEHFEPTVCLPLVGADLEVGTVEVGAATAPDAAALALARLALAGLGQAVARDELDQRFRAAFEHSPIGFSIREGSGRLLACNDAYARLLDRPVDELLTSMPPDAVHPEDLPRVHSEVHAMIDGASDHLSIEFRLLRGTDPDRVTWCRSTSSVVRHADGSVRYVLALFEDVTEARLHEEARRRADARYRRLVEHAPLVILSVGPDDRIVFAGDESRTVLGAEPDELIGAPLGAIGLRGDDLHSWRAAVRSARLDGRTVSVETPVCRDGRDRWLSGRVAPDGDGGATVYAFDVTEHHLMQDQLQYAARHDSLTGLANRAVFLDELTAALRRSVRRGWLAVLFVDLDRFKLVNDTLGHGAGDDLLVHVAKRITTEVRDADVIGRLGGDEFVLILEDLASPQQAVRVAQRLVDVIAEPVVVGGQDMLITASVGVSLHDDGAIPEADDLLRDADRAMYRAKQNGRHQVAVFDESMRELLASRNATESALRHALPNGELELFAQPEIDLVTSEVLGAEVLIRWRHPDRGLLVAGEFVEIAEDSGAILAIDPFVLAGATDWLARWQSRGLDMTLRVNLSRRTLASPGLPDDIARLIERSGLEPGRLCLEVTETALLHDLEAVVATLTDLRAVGVGLAIDDFGTGYSSLSQLKAFPVDTLKIDRSFVAGLPDSPSDLAIVQSVIGLAAAMDLDVVAEGVETRAQADCLVELGARRAQGWLFGRPRPIADLPDATATT